MLYLADVDMPEAWEVLLIALKRYLSRHGARILSITGIIGQRQVRISLDSLFHYHEPLPEYPRLMDAVRAILEQRSQLERLNKVGVTIDKEGDSYFIRSTRKVIHELIQGPDSVHRGT